MDLPKEFKEKAVGRQKFVHNNQTVYEWEQSIDEINIYINPPKFVLPKYRSEFEKQLKPGEFLPKLDISIQKDQIKVGIKGNPPFINEKLEKICTVSDSFWMIEDDELHINLQKMYKGELWECVFKGHKSLDPISQEEVKKKLLLERFQEENPGFDFSQAEFNGMAPNAREFMGGINYK